MVLSKRFNTVTGILWDLDNTLYRVRRPLYESFNKAVAGIAVARGLCATIEEAQEVCRDLYAQYKNSYTILEEQLGLSQIELLRETTPVVDLSSVAIDEDLLRCFDESDIEQHAVLTHGSHCWAERLVKRIGLKPHFPDDLIMGLDDFDMKRKDRDQEPFLLALDSLALDAGAVLFVEDSAENLVIAKDLGFKTALVDWRNEINAGDVRHADIVVPCTQSIFDFLP